MIKKRLLITLSFSFSVRYIVRTGLLDDIAKFVTPVIILTWYEEPLITELKNKGYEVYVMQPQQRGPRYLSVIKQLDFYHYNYVLQSRSKQIEEKYTDHFKNLKKKIIRRLKYFRLKAKFLSARYRNSLIIEEKKMLYEDTNCLAFVLWIRQLKADAVFTITPFHPQEDLFLRAAKETNCKMITSILSFDNLTKRNRIPVEYDIYLVWNKYNYAELINAYSFAANKKIFITGAPQFDFYFSKNYLYDKQTWINKLQVSDYNDQKIILYSGGPPLLFPDEPVYLKDLAEALNENKIIGNPFIVFRCHPADKTDRWKAVIKQFSNIIFDSAWNGKKNCLTRMLQMMI